MEILKVVKQPATKKISILVEKTEKYEKWFVFDDVYPDNSNWIELISKEKYSGIAIMERI